MAILNRPTPIQSATDPEWEKDISGQLVRLIDILFGLVIVQGALFYRSILSAHGARNAPVILALALIMYTVVRSFVDWHTFMEHHPYRISTASHPTTRPRWSPPIQVRTLDLWRLYVDFIIVATYAVLLLRAHVLLSDPAADLRFFMYLFPGVFLLYLLWGELLRLSSGALQFTAELLLIFIGLSLALAILYNVAYDHRWLTGYGTLRNLLAVGVAALIMAGYRFLNWKQQQTVV